MSENNPYEAPSPREGEKPEDTKPSAPTPVDQPFAAYGGTAGFIFNIFI